MSENQKEEEKAMQQKLKIAVLILDWNLWPRASVNQIDYAHVKKMVEAAKAGDTLPPIVVDKKTKKVVDGFHRLEVARRVEGDEGEIVCDVRNFKDDAAMLVAAAELNARHGMPLTNKDRARVISIGLEMGVSMKQLAKSLGMGNDYIEKFLDDRTAFDTADRRVPLAAGAKDLAGRKLNRAQMDYVNSADRNGATFHAAMLLKAIKAGVVDWDNEKTVARMTELYREIGKNIERVEVS